MSDVLTFNSGAPITRQSPAALGRSRSPNRMASSRPELRTMLEFASRTQQPMLNEAGA
jgi:hypothetical protein